MEKNEIELIVRRTLSEEVGEHRAFLTQQFKQITWGIGILFTVAATLFAFMLGSSITETKEKVIQTIDDKIFEYRIAKELKVKVNEHVAVAVKNNVESKTTKKQLDDLIKEKTDIYVENVKSELEKTISSIVAEKIQVNSGLNAEELIKKHILPQGAVLAFNKISCPRGWLEYTPAYGRFIRGIDKSGQKIDSEENRKIGSLQDDTIKLHNHQVNDPGHAHNMGPFSAVGGIYDSGSSRSAWAHYSAPNKTVSVSNTNISVSSFGTEETRPKNVSLLYCVKS